MLKEDLGYRHSVIQICYVCAYPEQSLITLQLENIGLDFSLGKNLSACVVCTLSNHEDIFSMIAEDLMAIGIRDEILLVILLCF